MTEIRLPDQAKDYIRKNWFKLAIALLLIFIAMKKDLSFNINLNAPSDMEKPYTQPRQNVGQERGKRETYTDKLTKTNQSSLEAPGVLDKFEFPTLGGSTGAGPTAEEQLLSLDEQDLQSFTKRFARVAVAEKDKFGIPASIVMANGLLQSRAGRSEAAKKGNSYFALPCTPDWEGETGKYGGKCVRHYENAWTSFRDHSFFLTTGANAPLTSLGNKDYKAWAKALEKIRFTEERDLAGQLVRLIERYKLNKLDDI